MSGAVSPLKDNPHFVNLLTKFENPFMGIIVGIAFTAVLQSASASVGILQALSVTGSISFAAALPITMGIGVGAACPVLLSSIGTNKNGKRTALIYLLNDLFGMIFWSIVFYSVNAFVHFKFLNMTMSPIKIAMMNSIFRLATIMILLPCINLIEKLVFRLIKDDPEDLEEQADFDLLEERFLAYPALAIGQSHTAVNGMAKKAVMGNLHDIGDWDTLWNSDQAKAVRAATKQCDRNCWMIGSVSPAMHKYIWVPAWWVVKHKFLKGGKYSLSENAFIPEAQKE